MNPRLKNHLALTAIVGMLAIAGSLMNLQQTASAQGPPNGLAVRIVDSVPLPTVSTISGTVAVTQSGAWAVGINGTPNVNINNTPTVNLSGGTAVKVNPGDSPLRIRDVNDGAQPFQTEVHVTVPHNACCGPVGSFSVPSGKRLVIEDVSSSVEFKGGEVANIKVTTTVGGQTVEHPVLWIQSLGAPTSVGSAGRTTRIYADQSTTVSVTIARYDIQNPAGVSVAISGYLVDVP